MRKQPVAGEYSGGYSHLLALLHERRERAAQVLHDEVVRATARQPVRRLHAQLVQHERRHHRVHRAHAELVQVLRAQTLRDPQQPLDVLTVRGVPT